MQDIIDELLNVPEETETLEFKRLDGPKVVAKVLETIVAMANTDGGRIVIGIDDPEKTTRTGIDRVYGIEENPELLDEIKRKIQVIVPPVIGNSAIQSITASNGKTVEVLNIAKATICFHSVNNHVFVRLRKSNKVLSPQEVIKLSYAKGFEKADKELVDVDLQLLNTEVYREWKDVRKLDGDDIQKVLFRTGLARKNDTGKIVPTRAAVLLFADFPTNLMDTKCAIRVMQYTGRLEHFKEIPNLIAKPVTIEGPLVKLIERAHEYVLTLLRSGIEIHSGFITKYQIPERVIKEAITNAVIHRDYHIKRDIEIKIFEDRVEIKNPGLFPYNITSKNIGRVRSDGYRNDLVVKHLREFPTPPNLDQNEGVQAMQNTMYAEGLFPPRYWTYPIYDDSVEVGLFNENRPGEWEKIKEFLLQNKYIANQQAREVTGIIQVTKMSQLLSRWTAQGLLTKIIPNNSKKNALYKLASQDDINEQ